MHVAGEKCPTVVENGYLLPAPQGVAMRAPAEMLSRITVYLFVAGKGRCLLATPFVAEAVISHPGPQGAKGGAPGPGWG